MNSIDEVMLQMMDLYTGDTLRIQHFIKVHSLARLIGRMSNLDNSTMNILEIAALTHDIGIHEAERKYGSCDGPLQEKEGPPLARDMLLKMNFSDSIIDRVCYLIAHHHTYTQIDSIDYQILVEADFLVNLHEGTASPETIITTYNRIFKTEPGRTICRKMFNL